MRVETAPRMPPTSRTPLHAAPRARVMGSGAREESYHGKNRPPARAPFWAWPNNLSRLCVAQARGLLSVYKKRGTFLYPYTCARPVGAAPTVTLSRTGEVSQGKTEAQDEQSNANSKTTKSRGTKQVSTARPLPGQLAPHQQSEPPLSPRSPTPSSTWGQGSGRHLRGGMQIFVKTYSRLDED